MRKERENLLCKHLLLYISRTNRGSVSGTFRLHSNLLKKADYDEKRGLLFHQIILSPVITFDCLQQFTGFYFGKLFYRLAQNITGILFGNIILMLMPRVGSKAVQRPRSCSNRYSRQALSEAIRETFEHFQTLLTYMRISECEISCFLWLISVCTLE